MKGVIYRYAYALLAVSQAKRSAQINLSLQVVFTDQALQIFYYLTGAFNMAGNYKRSAPSLIQVWAEERALTRGIS